MLQEDFPEIPLGHIYLAANEIVKAEFYGGEYPEPIIEYHLGKALEMSRSLYETNQQNIWHNYFMALSEGYSAYYKGLKGNYISAFTQGYDALDYFNECLAIDSTFYESYIALGTYKYWISAKTEILNWLPFFPDDKESGIKILEKAVKHNSYNYHLAVNSITWIYIEEGKYQRAVEISKPVFEKYPGNKFIGLALAAAYRNINPGKAVEVYKQILISLKQTGDPYKFNEVLFKYKIVKMYLRMNKNAQALKVCNEILDINNIPEITKEKLDGKLTELKDIREKLS